MVATAVAGLLAAATVAPAYAQPDFDFDRQLGLGLDGTAISTVLQPDGSIIVGGDFTTLGGTNVPDRLIRLNPDGTLDTAFNSKLGTGFNGAVNTVALQPGGRLLVGGDFTTLNNLDVPDRLVRLNADGSKDSAFNTNLSSGFTGAGRSVDTVEVQSDGKILVGGVFSTLGLNAVPQGLLRLNDDGTRDAAFNTNLGTGFNDNVEAAVEQPDGKILVGGRSITLNSLPIPGVVMRLNADGTPDAAFNTNLGTGFTGEASDFAVQPDGKILAALDSTSLNGVSIPHGLVRLNANGTPDTAFNAHLGTGFDGYFLNVSVQPDGKVVAAGNVTQFNGASIPASLVRFNADGTRDTAFATSLGTGIPGIILSANVQPDGHLLLAGAFTSLNGRNVPTSLMRLVATAGAPRSLRATAGDASASLSWRAPLSDGGSPVTTYEFTTAPAGGTCEVTGGAFGYVQARCTGLTNGTAHTISVTPVTSAGDGSRATVSVTPRSARTVPGRPGPVSVTVGRGTAALTWTAPTSDGGTPITAYRITKNRSRGTCSVTSVILATVRATCTGLASGVSHVFTVRAVNAVGASASRSSSAIRVTALPGTVRGLTVRRAGVSTAASATTVRVRAAWVPPTAFGGLPVSGYQWCVGTCRSTNAWHAARGRVVLISGLSADTSHVLRVRAVNAGGAGAIAALRFTA